MFFASITNFRNRCKPTISILIKVFFHFKRSVVPNVWTHVGFVLNKGLSKAFFYQDGVQVSWGTSTNKPLPSPVRTVFDIGLKRDTNQVMRGWIRDLMVFDREMSTEDMRRIRGKEIEDSNFSTGL